MAERIAPLVWIDCEMTGLNPDTESILEIFCLVTAGDLQLLEPHGFHAIIHHSPVRLAAMDFWCTKTHAESGLTEQAVASTTTAEEAAENLLDYVCSLVPTPKVALLAGNSVHADQAFLRKAPFTPVLEHLHYRILDVSSIKEAARRWSPGSLLVKALRKKGRHRAREDIMESIEEARYYKESIFARTGRSIQGGSP